MSQVDAGQIRPSDGKGKVAIITLGCGRNDVDSDNVGGLLTADGYDMVTEPDDADLLVVNTCTFIAPAREESVDVVLGATDTTKPVVVVGCMAERYGQELADAVPEAAAVVGFDRYRELPQIVGSALGVRDPNGDAVASDEAPASRRGLPLFGTGPSGPDAPPTASFPLRTVPKGPWAYLKIAGGCDRVCTFCSIPSFRGRFGSRTVTELEAEVRWLVEQGVRELVCVSENTTSYHKDLPGGRRGQADLIEMFDRVEGLEMVRLMYLQPAEITPLLLESMAASDTVVPYYDLSLQHASAPVLDRMARSGSPERFLRLIEGIRQRDPGAVFRSSFITGFPGETDEDVDTLASFVDAAGLDWSGVFTYSAEDGTPAATMPDQVPHDEARARAEEITQIIEAVALEKAEAFVGRRLEVLVEDHEAETAIGRSYREAPETDGEIRVEGLGTPVGRLAPVVVTSTDGVDLLARPA
ncbi:30S ribosomal protein S12 methylthiotransferase RimO [Euzebya tangerina]|uniref:30S ribosomal protein S12 methylthiotransferase RimO n=1 Tax=Euzebya tangerina TaxID=591198 RepID=UPI00196AC5BA|nr:30S ribosomal protein S12 methylthiotransferase RimO [Euzebya tangerina]